MLANAQLGDVLGRLTGITHSSGRTLVIAYSGIAADASIVSIASLIGVSQLGDLLVDGYNRAISGELAAGILGCVLLAVVLDLAIRLVERLLTPWRRAGQEGSA